MSIGEKLGKSLAEVRELPASEVTLWVAYFKMQNAPKEDKPESDLVGFKKMMGV